MCLHLKTQFFQQENVNQKLNHNIYASMSFYKVKSLDLTRCLSFIPKPLRHFTLKTHNGVSQLVYPKLYLEVSNRDKKPMFN